MSKTNAMGTVEPETVDDIIKSMLGMEVTYNDPFDLIARLAHVHIRELDALYQEIDEIKWILGL